MTGDEDDRQDRTAQVQLLLELQTAHAGHAHIEHQAARLPGIVALEKLLSRRQRGGGESHRLEQQSQRVSNGFIVIDDEYDRGPFFHLNAALDGVSVAMKQAPFGSFGR